APELEVSRIGSSEVSHRRDRPLHQSKASQLIESSSSDSRAWLCSNTHVLARLMLDAPVRASNDALEQRKTRLCTYPHISTGVALKRLGTEGSTQPVLK